MAILYKNLVTTNSDKACMLSNGLLGIGVHNNLSWHCCRLQQIYHRLTICHWKIQDWLNISIEITRHLSMYFERPSTVRSEFVHVIIPYHTIPHGDLSQVRRHGMAGYTSACIFRWRIFYFYFFSLVTLSHFLGYVHSWTMNYPSQHLWLCRKGGGPILHRSCSSLATPVCLINRLMKSTAGVGSVPHP